MVAQKGFNFNLFQFQFSLNLFSISFFNSSFLFTKDAIEFCYTPDVIAKAKELGVLLMEEDGVGAGVDAFLAKVPGFF